MKERARQFAAQIAYLQKAGKQFVPFGAALLDLGAGPERYAVSFDDGDSTVCEVAQPILDGLGVKAMLYLSTDYVRSGSTYKAQTPLPAASWEQLGRWLEAGHEIGSHTHTHKNMAACAEAEAMEELETSRLVIRRELGVEVSHFAYPWGRHNGRTRDWLARNATWASAATIERGVNTAATDPLRLRRDVLEPGMSLGRMRLTLAWGGSGLYRWQAGLRQARQENRP